MQDTHQVKSTHTIYERIGGEEGVRRLVKLFYDIVESDPAGKPLMAMHNKGNGLAHARVAQFDFLSGFLGGPQLYVERHGHSNVRKIHEHLKVRRLERDSWVNCMAKALEAHDADPQTRSILMAHVSRIAGTLVNTE